MASLAEKIQKPTTVIDLELLAARQVALFTQEMGLHRVVLEGDTEFVTHSLKYGTNFGSMHGYLIKDREMICLQHFYNISTTNPKWQVITSCYCWDKKVILPLVSNSNQ